MEWILIVAGIAYSLYSSYKKEQKQREQNPQRPPRITARNAADRMSAQSSGRRTLSALRSNDINTVQAARAYGQDVTTVQELSLEDMQEDFTTRLNRKLLERNMQLEGRASYENFGDTAIAETERVRDYDDLASYDERPATRTSSEHEYASHFKLNEGLRRDKFKVSATSAFDDVDFADDVYEAARDKRSPIVLDRRSLKSYMVMHEILSKPRSLKSSIR